VQAGRLRHRVVIEDRAETRDADGDPLPVTWSTFADKVPAEIAPLSARDLVAAQAAQSEVSVRITIRWLPGLKARMRIRDLVEGTVYNIAGTIADNRSGREWITIPCTEGVNDG